MGLSIPWYESPPDPTCPFQRNNTPEECKRLSQQELVKELKQRGTYNPDLMAWDIVGVIRFLDRTITDQYEVGLHPLPSREAAEATEESDVVE